jgi:hypothetical protein
MRRSLALVALALALALWPSAAFGAEPRRPVLPPLALYDNSGDASGLRLARLDPVTLAPQTEGVEIPEWHGGYAIAPDLEHAAFTISTGRPVNGVPGQGRGGVRVVNLDSMQIVTDIQNGVAAEALGWLRPGRLIVVNQGGPIVATKPLTGEIVDRPGRIGGQCIDPPGKGRSRRALVVLIGRRLYAIDKFGRSRAVLLSGMPSDCHRLGMSIDFTNDRAFVTGAGPHVAEVALDSMRVTRRPVPRSSASGIVETRTELLGLGRIVATHHGSRGSAKGVELIVPAAGTRRMIDSRGGVARVVDNLIVVAGGSRGVRVYDPLGRLVYRILDREVVTDVLSMGSHVYARSGGTVHVIDLRRRAVYAQASLPAGRELVFLLP